MISAKAPAPNPALELWPDCADPWVILAENMTESLDEVHQFYAAGVEAGGA